MARSASDTTRVLGHGSVWIMPSSLVSSLESFCRCCSHVRLRTSAFEYKKAIVNGVEVRVLNESECGGGGG